MVFIENIIKNERVLKNLIQDLELESRGYSKYLYSYKNIAEMYSITEQEVRAIDDLYEVRKKNL